MINYFFRRITAGPTKLNFVQQCHAKCKQAKQDSNGTAAVLLERNNHAWMYGPATVVGHRYLNLTFDRLNPAIRTEIIYIGEMVYVTLAFLAD